jgi:hypothetical protein
VEQGHHDLWNHVYKERIRGRLKGTSGLALPLAQSRHRGARCFVLAGTNYKTQLTKIVYGHYACRQLHDRGDQSESCAHNTTAAAFDDQIHRLRWVDSPESADLIGKISIVGTAIVADVSEG